MQTPERYPTNRQLIGTTFVVLGLAAMWRYQSFNTGETQTGALLGMASCLLAFAILAPLRAIQIFFAVITLTTTYSAYDAWKNYDARKKAAEISARETVVAQVLPSHSPTRAVRR